jgi:hypothetical protein
MEENKYPEKAIEVIDKYFPKGDKRRGEALVLLAVAYNEGKDDGSKNDESKGEIGASNFVMGEDVDRFVMLKESEIQTIIDELGRIPHDLFTFMNYEQIIEKLKWKEPPIAELLTKEGEPEKCENCGKIITPEMKEGQDVIYAGAEHTMSSEVGEMIPYRDEMYCGAYCCQDCYEEQSGIKRAFKKGYEKGYDTALDDNNILHGEDADKFLANMKKTEEEAKLK